jgi:hypothetical protein
MPFYYVARKKQNKKKIKYFKIYDDDLLVMISLLYSIILSIELTLPINMRLQHIRCIPNLFSAHWMVIPDSSNWQYSSHLLPITLPQEKHLTGIIISIHIILCIYFSFLYI